MMQMKYLTSASAVACGFFLLSTDLSNAGAIVIEPVEPVLALPFASGPTGITSATPGSAEAVSATLDVANAYASQLLSVGLPALTAGQRTTALARLAEVIEATGGSPELNALVAAVVAAPAID